MTELFIECAAYGEITVRIVTGTFCLEIDQPYEGLASAGLNKDEARKLRDCLNEFLGESNQDGASK